MTERIRALQMNEDNRRWWALGAMCFALFMIMLDNTAVNVALPSIQRSLHASTSSLEWTVNAYTLSFAVLLVTGGPPRRPVRPAQDLPRGRHRLRRLERRDRLLDQRHVARGLARRAGRRLGADDARHAVDHHQRVSRRRARQGDRHVGGRLGDGARDRPGRRRPARGERQLAVDLLPQPPSRRRRRARVALRGPRVARRNGRPAHRPARCGDAHRRTRRARSRARRGQQLALGLDARDRAVRRRAARARRLRHRREPPVLPDGRLRLLPLAHVPRRQHRRLHRQLRDARDVLLHGSLHAEHAAATRRCRPACASCPRR